MKKTDTSMAYMVGLRYVLLPTIVLLLIACTRQETEEFVSTEDITFQASERAIVTAANGYALRFQEDGIYMQTPDDMDGWKFKIGGADQAAIQVDDWNENELWYRNIYPKINLRFFDKGKGNAGYDFRVKAGGDPSQICLTLEGKGNAHIAKQGELVLPTKEGEIRHSIPYAYQEIDGTKQLVSSKFVLEDGCLSFAIGAYDKRYDLIIN